MAKGSVLGRQALREPSAGRYPKSQLQLPPFFFHPPSHSANIPRPPDTANLCATPPGFLRTTG
jgi:hypothetical protein